MRKAPGTQQQFVQQKLILRTKRLNKNYPQQIKVYQINKKFIDVSREKIIVKKTNEDFINTYGNDLVTRKFLQLSTNNKLIRNEKIIEIPDCWSKSFYNVPIDQFEPKVVNKIVPPIINIDDFPFGKVVFFFFFYLNNFYSL